VDISQAIGEHHAVMASLEALVPAIERCAHAIAERLRTGGTALWFGNGGSATQAQHLATELLGRYELERRGFRSIALTADTALITAVANDYGFDTVFARQVEALGGPNDVVIGLSTSGNSPNVLQGIDAGNQLGALTVGLAGNDGGKLAQIVDIPIVVAHPRTARVQEAHLFIGHALCEIVELMLAEGGDVRPT
jgi:D-sedoheptulose 7-phosphate isomerase